MLSLPFLPVDQIKRVWSGDDTEPTGLAALLGKLLEGETEGKPKVKIGVNARTSPRMAALGTVLAHLLAGRPVEDQSGSGPAPGGLSVGTSGGPVLTLPEYDTTPVESPDGGPVTGMPPLTLGPDEAYGGYIDQNPYTSEALDKLLGPKPDFSKPEETETAATAPAEKEERKKSRRSHFSEKAAERRRAKAKEGRDRDKKDKTERKARMGRNIRNARRTERNRRDVERRKRDRKRGAKRGF